MMSNRKFGQGLAASGDGGQQFRAMVSCRKGQGLICVTSGRKVNILVGGMSSYNQTTMTGLSGKSAVLMAGDQADRVIKLGFSVRH